MATAVVPIIALAGVVTATPALADPAVGAKGALLAGGAGLAIGCLLGLPFLLIGCPIGAIIGGAAGGIAGGDHVVPGGPAARRDGGCGRGSGEFRAGPVGRTDVNGRSPQRNW
ncbi:hypothetical protein [Nocardia brasiliensis]|uniref:hypothetical protein n=1 Tax=Nocardia brasiliensis TaxID=37326 RepID=UPI0024581488|nr:hypothetical protein [Nocardia brasiliensis]